MPWLIKDERDQDNLLFIHVPRCGGTSLTKLFKVPQKATEGRGPYHKLGMMYFFYRYKLLESRNFPLATIENLFVALWLGIAFLLWWFELAPSVDPDCVGGADELCPPGIPSIVMICTATITFICSTFLFTAPVSGRIDFMRRAYSVFVGRILCGLTSADNFLTGVSEKGYVVHFTAPKVVKHGFLSYEEMKRTESFAIVRNPFTRLVSIYMYNRFGPLESFDHFVEEWALKVQAYREKKSTEEKDAYCHVLPEFEFTHMDGQQLVQSVIKQEDLKDIVKGRKNECFTENGVDKIPPRVLKALKDMPHSNRRQRDKPWQDYYSERTMRLCVEMYREDFELYGYEMTIPGRPDLDNVFKGDLEEGELFPLPNEQPQLDNFSDDSSSNPSTDSYKNDHLLNNVDDGNSILTRV